MKKSKKCYINTDKEIWRKIKGDYYSPSIHITLDNKVGINIGGCVFVMSIEKWHLLAKEGKEHFRKISKEV